LPDSSSPTIALSRCFPNHASRCAPSIGCSG
jgi:hypothetical protein